MLPAPPRSCAAKHGILDGLTASERCPPLRLTATYILITTTDERVESRDDRRCSAM